MCSIYKIYDTYIQIFTSGLFSKCLACYPLLLCTFIHTHMPLLGFISIVIHLYFSLTSTSFSFSFQISPSFLFLLQLILHFHFLFKFLLHFYFYFNFYFMSISFLKFLLCFPCCNNGMSFSSTYFFKHSFKLSYGSYVCSVAGYPFQSTKYSLCPSLLHL